MGVRPHREGEEELRDLLDAVVLLRSGDIRGANIIGVYHARGVAALMAHTLMLYEMPLNAPREGTVLSRGPHCNSEIEQRIREAMDVLDDTFEFLILGHPGMRPNVGSIELVSPFLASSPSHRFFRYSILRTRVRSSTSMPEPPMRHCRRMRPSER